MEGYLLDTSVIIKDPNSIFSFNAESNVYISIGAVRELDKIKHGRDSKSAKARQAIRILDKIITSAKSGIYSNDETGYEIQFIDTRKHFEYADPELEHILKEHSGLTLVTGDTSLNIMANIRDFKSIKYDMEGTKMPIYDLVDLKKNVDLPSEIHTQLIRNGVVELDPDESFLEVIYPGQYIFPDRTGGVNYYVENGKHFLKAVRLNGAVYGVEPKNKEQRCAIDICTNPNIKVGAILGKAGSGKSFLSIASGLEQTISPRLHGEKLYDQIIVVRPVVTVGKTLGFLPGGANEKTKPLFEAVHDVFNALFENAPHRSGEKKKSSVDYLIREQKVIFETPTFMRGRDFKRTYIIIDEAQNMTRENIRMLITRVGEGSKIIFQGDPHQHENESNNGLVHIVKRLKGKNSFRPIILDKSLRGVSEELADFL